MRLESNEQGPSGPGDRFTVDAQALIAAAGRVANSADAYAQDDSMLSGLPAACANTPVSSACDELASKIGAVLAEQTSATSSLAEALIQAADAYSAADQYAA